MLTDNHVDPLDLDDELEDADADDVIDLLEPALADPRASGDESYEEYLDRLTDAYAATGRERDGIAAYERIAQFNLADANALTVARAKLHTKIGEAPVAINLIGRLWAAELARPPAERDFVGLGSAAMLVSSLAGGDALGQTIGAEALVLARQFGSQRDIVFFEVMLGDGPLAIGRKFPPRKPSPIR